MPEQQPQRQSDVPAQLTVFSLSPLHGQSQLTVVGEAGVVFEARNLERSQRDLALAQVNRSRRRALWLERGCYYALHARYFARSRVNGAQVNRLSKREFAGIEHTFGSVGQDAAAEHLHECALHIGAEVVGIDADG